MIHAWGIWMKQELRFLRMDDLLPGDAKAMLAFFTKDEADEQLPQILDDNMLSPAHFEVLPLERP